MYYIHSFVEGHFGCFYVLAIVIGAAMNIRVHVSVWIMIFSSCISKSGIAGSLTIFFLAFLRNLLTVLHSDCTNLHSYQQCRRVPFFPTPSPEFIIFRLFNHGHSEQCEVAVLICISLRINDVGHLFVCLSSVWLLWRNLYLCLLPIFQLGCLFFDTELCELFVYFGN